MAKKIYSEPVAYLGRANVFTQNNFTGGQNEAVSDTLLSVHESPSASNIRLDVEGILKPSKGRTKVFQEDFSENGVLGLHGYYKSTGLKQLIVAVDGAIKTSTLKTDVDYDLQVDFETGTLGTYVSATVSPGYVVLSTASSDLDFNYEYDSKAEFDVGTLDNVTSEISDGYIELASSGQDYSIVKDEGSDYDSGTFDDISTTAEGIALVGSSGVWNDYNNSWEEL